MIDENDLKEIQPNKPTVAYTAGHVVAGLPIPKTKRIELFSADDWEDFVSEWASSLKSKYSAVRKLASAGDKGLDVVGFLKGTQFAHGWHNYQCKHYDHALVPSDVWIEIGKIVYYSFSGEYPFPKRYFFVAPFGIGTSLTFLLGKPDDLKAGLIANWPKHCELKLTNTPVALTKPLLDYIAALPFDIFDSVSVVELIEQHAQTPFHSVRFGGGLPPRAAPTSPPTAVHSMESRYVQQLYAVYSEYVDATLDSPPALKKHPELDQDFLRQRERFYSAEALRNFARDNVPANTFEELENDALHGVVDTCDLDHANGMTRMKKTLEQASSLEFQANPLFSVITTLDKLGLCHQLANKDALIWVKTKKK